MLTRCAQLARHSEVNRLKILQAFETLPNIIEAAHNKADNLPLDTENMKSVKLHGAISDLHVTLIRTIPPLINKLIPGTFRTDLPHKLVEGWLSLTAE